MSAVGAGVVGAAIYIHTLSIRAIVAMYHLSIPYSLHIPIGDTAMPTTNSKGAHAPQLLLSVITYDIGFHSYSASLLEDGDGNPLIRVTTSAQQRAPLKAAALTLRIILEHLSPTTPIMIEAAPDGTQDILAAALLSIREGHGHGVDDDAMPRGLFRASAILPIYTVEGIDARSPIFTYRGGGKVRGIELVGHKYAYDVW
jgi:hypothetical protein